MKERQRGDVGEGVCLFHSLQHFHIHPFCLFDCETESRRIHRNVSGSLGSSLGQQLVEQHTHTEREFPFFVLCFLEEK